MPAQFIGMSMRTRPHAQCAKLIGLRMHSTRTPFYDKTLAHWNREVYPLDFSRQWQTGGLVCFFGFGLVISTWEAKVCPCIAPEDFLRSNPLDFSGRRLNGGLVSFFGFR
jgi:hypothetical protein